MELTQSLENQFDPKDIVAYGLGTSAFYAIEKLGSRKPKTMEPGIEYSIDINRAPKP